jgi:hypothetical protein
VRRHFSVCCLFAAWLCANGALLDVAQVFAWARMFTDYAQTESVAAALSNTFDPAKPCPICLAVEKARDASREQQPPAATVALEKIVLICQRAEILFAPAAPREWPETAPVFAPAWREPVPLPPPRIRFA